MKINKDMKTLTVIIPVHKLEDTEKDTLKKALNSIVEQQTKPTNVLVVVSKEVKDTVTNILAEYNEKSAKGEDGKALQFGVIENTGETDFCSQVNFGGKNCNTDYFSVLEFDDEYSKIWFKNANEYIEAYPENGMFMPIIVETDATGNFLHFTNEAVWANGFSERMGILDISALLQFPNFGTSGSVFNTQKFNDAGGFKSDIKLAFMYELLLRFANEDVGIMTIPKIGYKHTNSRPGSLFMQYRDPIVGIKPQEAQFYMQSAREEYFFNPNNIKREVKYVQPA